MLPLEPQRVFQTLLLFYFVLLYSKSLNDWTIGEQRLLIPSNLSVSGDEVEGNIEILGKQNSLFPSHSMLGWFSVAHKEKQGIILDNLLT